MRLIFDIETNGLYHDVTVIHCLVLRNLDTGEVRRYRQGTIEEGLQYLQENASEAIGHNIIAYDIPVIKKLYPKFHLPFSKLVDTLVISRVLWPDLWDEDNKLTLQGRLPANLKNRQSLEAWGYRLGENKGDYSAMMKAKGLDPWASWNQEMEEYCVQDTVVTQKLYARELKHFPEDGTKPEFYYLEHEVAAIIAGQERRGFAFDVKAAHELTGILAQRKHELTEELSTTFKSLYMRSGKMNTPKRSQNRKEATPAGTLVFSYTVGAVWTPIKLVQFNPGSRHHIAHWLKVLYGWEPLEFTDKGEPKLDETVVGELKYPEAQLLTEYLIVDKRLGQIAEGAKAWLRLVRNGRIYGSVNPNGAVTGRMTHSNPNTGQVPATYSPWGAECRALFTASLGLVLVGADADALELRCLAAYMGKYDGGSYIQTVLNGKKEDGTDIHSVNARALGLDPQKVYFQGETGRDLAKTWFYAFIYGAGDIKLGYILSKSRGNKARMIGKAARARFLAQLPALRKLTEVVKTVVKQKGYLIGLDGRKLKIRSAHSALNTLLQSAGAVIMKKALVLLDTSLALTLGDAYGFVANVHDEWQIETDERLGDYVGKEAVHAIQKAGEHFQFRCPLTGAYSVGKNWAETH